MDDVDEGGDPACWAEQFEEELFGDGTPAEEPDEQWPRGAGVRRTPSAPGPSTGTDQP